MLKAYAAGASLKVSYPELATSSEEFRTLRASQDVRVHCTGSKNLRHPSSGTSTSPSRP